MTDQRSVGSWIERSGRRLRASGGTASTDRARSAAVTALVFTEFLQIGPARLAVRHYSDRRALAARFGRHRTCAGRAIVPGSRGARERPRDCHRSCAMFSTGRSWRWPRRIIMQCLVLGAICFLALPRSMPRAKPEFATRFPAIDAEAILRRHRRTIKHALPDARSALRRSAPEREGTGIVIARERPDTDASSYLARRSRRREDRRRSRAARPPARVVPTTTPRVSGLVRPIAPLDVAPPEAGAIPASLAGSRSGADLVNQRRTRTTRPARASFRVDRFPAAGNICSIRAIFTLAADAEPERRGTDRHRRLAARRRLRRYCATRPTRDPHLPGNMFVPIER